MSAWDLFMHAAPELFVVVSIGVGALIAVLNNRRRVTEQQGGHGVTAARDGAQVGYEHPLAWPVRIVQGFPVALAPDGRCDRWHTAYQEWRPAEPALAAEARSRLQLEETQVDESLRWAEPLGAYTVPPVPPVPPDAPRPVGVQPDGSGGAHSFRPSGMCGNCGGGSEWARSTGTPCFGRPGEARPALHVESIPLTPEQVQALTISGRRWARVLGNGDEA